MTYLLQSEVKIQSHQTQYASLEQKVQELTDLIHKKPNHFLELSSALSNPISESLVPTTLPIQNNSTSTNTNQVHSTTTNTNRIGTNSIPQKEEVEGKEEEEEGDVMYYNNMKSYYEKYSSTSSSNTSNNNSFNKETGRNEGSAWDNSTPLGSPLSSSMMMMGSTHDTLIPPAPPAYPPSVIDSMKHFTPKIHSNHSITSINATSTAKYKNNTSGNTPIPGGVSAIPGNNKSTLATKSTPPISIPTPMRMPGTSTTDWLFATTPSAPISTIGGSVGGNTVPLYSRDRTQLSHTMGGSPSPSTNAIKLNLNEYMNKAHVSSAATATNATNISVLSNEEGEIDEGMERLIYHYTTTHKNVL